MAHRAFGRWVMWCSLWAVIGWGWCGGSPAGAAAPAEQVMDEASACANRLDSTPGLQRLRSSWERCIAKYAAMVTRHPDHPLAQTALLRQAELALALARRSGRPRDADAAARLFARHHALYPDAPSSADNVASASVTRVVIDPGHGGKDPGAIGIGGLMEKDVVLDVARRLRAVLHARTDVVPLLTRSDDRFLSLDERARFAEQRRADLFVSIHANASPRRDTQGVELYVLGRSSDEDANATARRENSTPGQDAPDTDALIQAILADLSHTKREEQSLELAYTLKESLHKTVAPRYRIPDLGVKRAPFFVLLNTDMPGVLSEISFLSNPEEAARLGNPSFRQRMAEALAQGIVEYVTSLVVARASE